MNIDLKDDKMSIDPKHDDMNIDMSVHLQDD